MKELKERMDTDSKYDQNSKTLSLEPWRAFDYYDQNSNTSSLEPRRASDYYDHNSNTLNRCRFIYKYSLSELIQITK